MPSYKQVMPKLIIFLATVLTFLLPLKYGSMAGLPEIVFSLPNTNIITIFIFTWSPVSFTLISALLLILTLIFIPQSLTSEINEDDTANVKKTNTKIMGNILIPIIAIFLLIATIPGFFNASTIDFAYLQILHFSGLSAYVTAMFLILKVNPEKKLQFLNAIIAGTLLISLYGLKQYYSGFQDTLDYIYNQELKTGVKVSSSIMNRLRQTRVYSTFSICNSLAAHLILTIPITIYTTSKFKSTLQTVCFISAMYTVISIAPDFPLPIMLTITTLSALGIIFAYKNINDKSFYTIRWFIIIPLAFLLLFILRQTGSRGGFLAFGISIIFLILFSKIKKKIKLIFSIIITLLATYLIFSDVLTRSLSSMAVRFDYYSAAFKMFLKHPIFGIGWGDFFHEYTKIKTFPSSEAPHTPHNFILSFASQSGLIGLLASSLVIISPFIWYFSKFRKHNQKKDDEKDILKSHSFILCILTGWLAWSIHSMLDLNIQIPGTIATAFLLLLLLPSKQIRIHKFLFSSIYNKFLKLCILLLSCIIIFYSYKRLQQEKALFLLQKLCSFNIIPQKSKKVPFEYIKYQLKYTCKLMPYSPCPWSNAALAAKNYGYYPKAEEYYKNAIKRSPQRALIYEKLSECQKSLNKPLEAQKNHNKALKLFPKAFPNTIKN